MEQRKCRLMRGAKQVVSAYANLLVFKIIAGVASSLLHFFKYYKKSHFLV
jgi:hypothetical protein